MHATGEGFAADAGESGSENFFVLRRKGRLCEGEGVLKRIKSRPYVISTERNTWSQRRQTRLFRDEEPPRPAVNALGAFVLFVTSVYEARILRRRR